MKTYCRHRSCQATTIQELLYLGGIKRVAEDVLEKAVDVQQNNLRVRCRRVPPPGPINAPFAPRQGEEQ